MSEDAPPILLVDDRPSNRVKTRQSVLNFAGLSRIDSGSAKAGGTELAEWTAYITSFVSLTPRNPRQPAGSAPGLAPAAPAPPACSGTLRYRRRDRLGVPLA